MTFVRIRAGVALTIALAAGVLGWTQTAARAAFPGGNGLIAWTRPFFLTDSEIYVMNPDGSGKRALTDNTSNDADPAWSADGSKMVFESVTGNAFNLYVINADGTGLYQLTTSTKRTDVQPAWSPDGTQVVFSRQKMDGTGAIWIINADGTGLHRITGEVSQNSHPNWSPDGTHIVFESDRSGG